MAGRPPLHGQAMTPAEKSKRYRERQKARREAGKPLHLVSQVDAALLLGITRQAVGEHLKAGNLTGETWQGRRYVVKPSVTE